MSPTTAIHGDAVRVLSSVFIIGQSDTRNTDHVGAVTFGVRVLLLNL